MSKTKTPDTKQAILEVLTAAPEATVAQIAVSAGVGRSTAGKMLGELESDGKVSRTAGGREGRRRLPDLWSLATTKQPAAAKDADLTAASTAGGAPTAPAGKPDRLPAGGLDPLVLAYLEENSDSGPHGPSQVAKALQRSSGAVGNCLERLRKDKKVKLATEKPRRYRVA